MLVKTLSRSFFSHLRDASGEVNAPLASALTSDVFPAEYGPSTSTSEVAMEKYQN